MRHRLLWDGLTRHAFRLDTGLSVIVAHQPDARRFALRLVIETGLQDERRESPGAVALLALTLGTSYADRRAGRITGQDATLGHHTVELALEGDDLAALATELALRASYTPPTDEELESAWARLQDVAADAQRDTGAQVANLAHRLLLDRNGAVTYTWPCGNRYYPTAAQAPMPPGETVRRRWFALHLHRLRLHVVSPEPGANVEGALRASPLSWWKPYRGDHAPKPLVREALLRPNRAHHPVYTWNGPVVLPSGQPGVTTLWGVVTLPSDSPDSAYLDLLARAGPWPFRVAAWAHPEGSILAAWGQSPVTDPQGPLTLVRDVQRAFRPLLEGQPDPALWEGARASLDADLRALLRDPGELCRALAAAERGVPPPVPRQPSPVAVAAAVQRLLQGVAPPRCAVLRPPGLTYAPHRLGRAMGRPLDLW